MVDQTILNFIKTALSKGYSEDYIINGLKARNWPLPAINEALAVAKAEMKKAPQQQPMPQPKPSPQPQPIQQPKQPTPILIKPQPLQQAVQKPAIEIKPKVQGPKKPINIKAYSLPSLAFLGIFLLITFTILVFFYMQGVMSYKVTDTDGIEKTKLCLNEDCSDLKDYAYQYANNNFVISIVIGLIVAALVLVGYILMPSQLKSKFFWAVNGLYFLGVLSMAIIWFIFNFS